MGWDKRHGQSNRSNSPRRMAVSGKIALSLLLLLALLLAASGAAGATAGAGEEVLGPQSVQARGEKRVLMVVVRFPDATPTTPLETVKRRVVGGLNRYVAEQSYGLASVNADFRGYVMLPDPLPRYTVSPYNYRVDRERIRKLIRDTMTAVEQEVDFAAYDHLLIIPAVQTGPGTGYGMICYCANPGMLSGVTKRYVPRYETLRSAGGKAFSGGILVATENANLGMFAHDYFHALGGIQGGKRLAPCLYDYDSQSDASAGLPAFEHHARYMGPWDIMSQHMVKKGEPPPGISSFTKIRLGWIGREQVRMVRPGETAVAFLAPLSTAGRQLAVKIPLADGTYYLIENRQPIGFDRILPDAGILVLQVDPGADEGFGTVTVKPAADSRNFSAATYRLEAEGRHRFLDRRNGVAVIPLWEEEGHLGVLVTTPEQGEVALKAARAIQGRMAARSGDAGREAPLREAVAAFKGGEFAKAHTIVTGQGR